MTDRKPTPAEVWRELAAQAFRLDPDQIRETILATEGTDGLRAAGYEPIGSSTGPGDALAEQAAHRMDRDRRALDARTHPDLARLAAAVADFVSAVAEVSRRCVSAKPCATWEEAVQDAHLLHEAGTIAAAIDVRVRLNGPIEGVERSLNRVQEIHDRHCAHPPTHTDQLVNGDVCLSHARIGNYEQTRHKPYPVCKAPCWNLIVALADRIDQPAATLAKDPDFWPWERVLRAHADMEMTGKRTDFHRERTAWLNSFDRHMRSSA